MALLKTKDLSIDPKDPWKDDIFDRQIHGNRLFALISSLREQPYVVAINGDWGTGKSVFLRRLEAHFEAASPKVPFIRIDAWAADDAADPLIPFTAAIHRRLEKTKQKGQAVRGELTKAAAKLTVPTAQFLATLTAPGSAGAVGAAAKFGTALIDWELEREKSTNKFKKALEDARDLLTGRREGGRIKAPIVIAIDELDRCRPDFSIRALERIKHFFNIAGVVFVIATDRGNLPAAVRSVYGASVDGELYLRKFFDFEYRLPAPHAAEYISVLWNEFGLHSVLPRSTGSIAFDEAYDNAEAYAKLLATERAALDGYEYRRYFVFFSDLIHLSLRDQTQAFTMLAAHILTTQKDVERFPILDTLLVCLRFFSFKAFDELNRRGENFELVLDDYEPRISLGLSHISKMGTYKALVHYMGARGVERARILIESLIREAQERQDAFTVRELERVLIRVLAVNRSGLEYVEDFLGLVHAFDPQSTGRNLDPVDTQTN